MYIINGDTIVANSVWFISKPNLPAKAPTLAMIAAQNFLDLNMPEKG